MVKMKVEITVEKDKFIVDVDGFKLDVYKDLENDIVEDPIKKAAWLSGVAYEVERRYYRFTEVEKKECLIHWKIWAVRWLKAKDMKDTADNVDCAVAKIFSGLDVDSKLDCLYSILRKDTTTKKRYERWEDFYRDDAVAEFIKNECSEMFKLEFEQNMTFDKVIDRESRMLSIVKSLKAASEAFKEKVYQEGRMTKLM